MIDDVSITAGPVGGLQRVMSGWTRVEVTRGMETMPSSFALEMTELYPGEAAALVLNPGDTCVVRIGADPVVTGYVDRVIPSVTAGSHSIRVFGRGKCADLVDCSAEWPGGQVRNCTALTIAQTLAMPYGITVTGADVAGVIPQFNVNWGETPFEIIDRVCRYAALLAYDLPDGSLRLERVGSTRAASGVTLGVNVQRATYVMSADQRFSDYVVRTISTSVFGDAAGTVATALAGGDIKGLATDRGVTRHRLKAIVETGAGFQGYGQQRAEWEASRRYGRAFPLMVQTDAWRDAGGALWAPNTLIPVSLPQLHLDGVSWTLSSVQFRRDERGTTADMVLMPPEAFNPEPTLWGRFSADILAAGAGL